MTFPENYGSRKREWLEVARTGVKQFTSSRVLQLTVLQTFFMTLAIWINSAWWVTYLVKEFNVSIMGTAGFYTLVYAAAAVAGFYISKMKETDYTKLIIYPTVFMALFYVLMPLAPTALLFTALLIGAIAGANFRTAGLSILENEIITEERATSLSFLATIRGGFWTAAPLLWGAVIQALGLKATFVMAAFCTAISLCLLVIALTLQRRTADPVNPEAK